MISDFYLQLSLFNRLIICILTISFLLQLFYYIWFYSRIILSRNSKKEFTESLPPVSVIIAAKNEEWKLPEYLPSILEQDYPDFQVVVVDDCSEDDTWDVLERFKKQYAHLYTTRIHFDPVFKHGKKMALSLGIKAAKNEILVFTDADCTPASKNWLRHMARNYTTDKEIVVGYSPIVKAKGLLNHIIRFDNLFTGIQYLASALAKKTYMGVGRNLSYTKSIFFRNKGFAPYIQMMSGDDDLFINKVANKKNTSVEMTPDSQVYTPAKKTWKDWIIQKRRHITTARYYRLGDKFRLGMEQLSRFLFYVSCIVAFISFPKWWIPLSIFGLRFLIQGLIINLSALKLKQPHFAFTFWILDILMPLFYVWMALKNATNPKGVKWK